VRQGSTNSLYPKPVQEREDFVEAGMAADRRRSQRSHIRNQIRILQPGPACLTTVVQQMHGILARVEQTL
jgi:hypothetical protein